ncbi:MULTISPECIES: Nif11-like leader peptide family natural product precursor [unclassified Moorena]|uniref:Nif11-like leader peptide family natural product precursor n=1 Tax=unclassified Moorena TaxID=2683338 RepID=UPI0013C62458|nr:MULTISPECIES: Nif11-like leader peptide family natural product precursor [unclassified Moorena]NEO22994.1 Nif11-like leader peptide family natural product precursor [Moorena sp. SIO4A5]NEQ60505.1 Nif11-like leader peptide family natural product precursor [Moorena sp. SIO4A1]
MSKQQLMDFIVAVKKDESLKAQLKDAQPEEIIRIAEQAGFKFSEEVKGRFRNRWAGVYSCPQREDINEICPALCPPGFKSLAEYSQSTCTPYDKEEKYDFRSGFKYTNVT